MDWAYFDRMEIEDFNKLKELNEDLKWFTKLEKNTLFDRIDIEAKDKKGRRVNRYILPVKNCIKLCRGEECRYCIMREK